MLHLLIETIKRRIRVRRRERMLRRYDPVRRKGSDLTAFTQGIQKLRSR